MRSEMVALAALATFACAIATVPAAADEIENVQKLDIAVSGTISPHCAMGSIGDMNFGNLERRGLGRETRVAFDCNIPFTMTIKGARGALTHTTMPNGQGPYGGAVPYSLAFDMPVRHPVGEMVSRTFDGQQLRAGGTISSNGGIATDGLLLAVQLGWPAGEAGLLAGEYTETITITVNPI